MNCHDQTTMNHLSIESMITSLKAFTSSPSPFRIIHSIPSPPRPDSTSTLLILDSSFNPPTKAHAYLIHQAISHFKTQYSGHYYGSDPSSTGKTTTSKARILLLLSTKNADKPSTPASTEERLMMMSLFAKDILSSLPESEATNGIIADDVQKEQEPLIGGIDIALSTEPRFLEKSLFLSQAGPDNPYLSTSGDQSGRDIAQYHLLGFDTLIRLLDGKYYPPTHSLEVLAPLFEENRNRIIVVRRSDGKVENDQEQEDYVKAFSLVKEEGGFGAKGWNVNWAEKIELVDGFSGVKDDDGEAVSVSSTAVRQAVHENRQALLRNMVSNSISAYISTQHLYK